ncbi:hypothetical protein NKH18_33550 [Streptomyces sp. M10(2022)]
MVASAALARAVHVRPLGMIAAGFLLSWGCMGIARAVHREVFEDFGPLWHEAELGVLTSFFLALAGAGTLTVLARRGPRTCPVAGTRGTERVTATSRARRAAVTATRRARPRAGPGQVPGPGPAPGYGYPQGGGYSPPPPSSPPSAW